MNKSILKFNALIFLLAAGIFLLSPSISWLINASSYLSARIALMYLSGTLGIVFMSTAVIIAARYSFINSLFGGLDKAYNMHKSAATLGFIFAFTHFFISLSNRLAIEYGIIPEPAHSSNHLHGFMLQIYNIGYLVVEPAFLVLMIVVIVAAVKKFPYHFFVITHRLIPLLYILISIHAFYAPFRGKWNEAIGGIILQAIIIIGTVSALIALFRQIGFNKKYKAVIIKKEMISSDIIHLKVKPNKHFIFKAGQFVFLKFNHSFEYHPFSIANYDCNDNILEFYIKQSGDFTNILYDKINDTSTITIEGPYGNFTFSSNTPQLWIAGGIGITPFLSRLEYLVYNDSKAVNIKAEDDSDAHMEILPTKNNITLVYSNIGKSPFEDKLKSLCKKANVNLVMVDTDKDGLLTYDKIKSIYPNITKHSIWFCGPYAFRKIIEKALKYDKINNSYIHFDVFTFR